MTESQIVPCNCNIMHFTDDNIPNLNKIKDHKNIMNVIPYDIIYTITSFLRPKNLCVLMKTNKELNLVVSHNWAWVHMLNKYNALSIDDLKLPNISYNFLIKNYYEEKRLKKEREKKELNKNIDHVTKNIFIYNMILKKIYTRNKLIILKNIKNEKQLINYGTIDIVSLNKFIGRLKLLINKNILTHGIYIDTVKYHTTIFAK